MTDGIRPSCLNCLSLEGIELADHPVPAIKCREKGVRDYDRPCELFRSGLALVREEMP